MKYRQDLGRLTLADVARDAGVSEITVSRVIRNLGPVAPATLERVKDAVRRLGYVPNQAASALATASSNLIGIIIPSLTNAVMSDLVQGANQLLEGNHGRTVIGVTDYDPSREEALVDSMMAWRPTGLIIAGLEHTERTIGLLKSSTMRVAEVLDTDGQGIDIVVGFSQIAAGKASAQHLIARGYRRFGYVGHGMGRDLRAGKRLTGFRQGLQEAGLALLDEERMPTASSIEAGRDALQILLSRTPSLDAIYFSNDDMALGGYFFCLAQGIGIPDRLALFGFNGLEVGRFAPQPLSSILTYRRLAGETAVRLFQEHAAASVTDLGFELFPGATC